MPDIGLLQGAPPRRGAPTSAVPLSDPPAAEAVAATFAAPVDAAIRVQVVSASPRVVESQPAGRQAPQSAQAEQAPAPPPVAETPAFAVQRAAPPPMRWSDLLWLALALIVIIGTGIGTRDPWPADEPRFAVIARDMVATGEWLFPRVGGDLYQDKPPLFFWMLAVCYSLLGSIKWSFLIPSFLAAGGTLFLVYDLGRRMVSREAGLAAALVTVCTLHFVITLRGAQIDPVLCFLTTFSLYALLRHLLLGPSWGWYFMGGVAAGLGVITKGVGFLPLLVLIPFFLLRRFDWRGLAAIDGGRLGWRWWLAADGAIVAICLWFVPMLIAVSMSGAPEYVAYRDEILFKQTVGRYAAAWHHVKPWYYFIVEVIPALWVPWSLLLFWLVPRFKKAFQDRDARVWMPLGWALLVLLFFSLSPGKRGVYVLPALPALAIAALPFIEEVLAKRGVRIAGLILAAFFWTAAAIFAIAYAAGAKPAVEVIAAGNLTDITSIYVYLLLCGAGLVIAFSRAPLAAWPVALGSLTLVFSCFIAPAMNPDKSGSAFVRAVLAQLKPEEELALLAYKEQFLLYLDRPTVNFGHRRWLEGPHESYDASAWLNAAPHRVMLVPADKLQPCFPSNATLAGSSSSEDWYLVRGPAAEECAAKGNAARAIQYDLRQFHD
jgi:4-amino-4-deoxy-L-arabinose transferase-like glycosyltransferase